MLARFGEFGRFNPCFLLALVVGAALAQWCGPARPQIRFEEDRIADIRGWISRPPDLLGDHIYLELTPLEISQRGDPITYPGRLGLYIASSNHPAAKAFNPPLSYGEILRTRAFLEDPSYFAIPGVPDFRQIFANQGLFHVVRLKSPLQIERDEKHFPASLLSPFFGYAEDFKEFLQQWVRPAEFKLIVSVFLGNKKVLEETDRNLLKNLGIFHLFVVSGFHVSLIVFFLHALLRSRGLAGRFLVIAALWGYVILVGWNVSAVRAGIMVTLFYLLLSFGLSRQFLNGLGLSALLFFALSPASLWSAGFQFSYLSLCAIGLFVLPLQFHLQAINGGFQDAFTDRIRVNRDAYSRRRRRVRFFLEENCQFWPRRWTCALLRGTGPAAVYFLGLALCSTFIQILTLPLSLYYTNRWIWTQWLANLALVPLFSLFVPLCLLLFVAYWLPGAGFVAKLLGWYAGLLDRAIALMGNLTPLSYLAQPSPAEMGVFFAILLGGIYLLRGRARAAGFLSVLLLWWSVQQPRPHDPSKLCISVLDVGQGESLHIRYPDGADALIDTGGFFSSQAQEDSFVGERLVSRYLWHERSRGLDFVLLTHAHADHTQGFRFVRTAFSVESLLFHDLPEPDLLAPSRRLEAGARFAVGGIDHRVLHPPGGTIWDKNNSSLVVELRYGAFKMLFTGDIEDQAERFLVPQLGPVTVLKAAHHGGRTSNSELLIRKTRPRLAVISAGRKSLFGHPAPQTLARFRAAGVPVLSTPEWGTLRIETNGVTWRVLHYSLEEGEFREVIPEQPLLLEFERPTRLAEPRP